MIIFLLKAFRVIERSGWKVSLWALFILFIAGYFAMNLFEPAGGDIARLDVYWWWFMVTTTTVGYGDFYPSSTGGRVAASIIMLGGIGAIGIVITQITAMGMKIRSMMMEGTGTYNMEGHLVILGYHQGRTEKIIEEILADEAQTNDVILCYDPEQADETPMHDLVKGVKGRLTSRDVMERSAIARAGRIVADGRDDNETLVMALAACKENKTGHVVAAVDDVEQSQEHLSRLDRWIECVPADLVTMVVQAVQDPGITRVYNRFLSNLEGHSGFRMDLAGDAGKHKYGDLLVHFKKQHDATLLGIALSHAYDAELIENPPWDREVEGGMSLYYIAAKRLSKVDLSRVK